MPFAAGSAVSRRAPAPSPKQTRDEDITIKLELETTTRTSTTTPEQAGQQTEQQAVQQIDSKFPAAQIRNHNENAFHRTPTEKSKQAPAFRLSTAHTPVGKPPHVLNQERDGEFARSTPTKQSPNGLDRLVATYTPSGKPPHILRQEASAASSEPVPPATPQVDQDEAEESSAKAKIGKQPSGMVQQNTSADVDARSVAETGNQDATGNDNVSTSKAPAEISARINELKKQADGVCPSPEKALKVENRVSSNKRSKTRKTRPLYVSPAKRQSTDVTLTTKQARIAAVSTPTSNLDDQHQLPATCKSVDPPTGAREYEARDAGNAATLTKTAGSHMGDTAFVRSKLRASQASAKEDDHHWRFIPADEAGIGNNPVVRNAMLNAGSPWQAAVKDRPSFAKIPENCRIPSHASTQLRDQHRENNGYAVVEFAVATASANGATGRKGHTKISSFSSSISNTSRSGFHSADLDQSDMTGNLDAIGMLTDAQRTSYANAVKRAPDQDESHEGPVQNGTRPPIDWEAEFKEDDLGFDLSQDGMSEAVLHFEDDDTKPRTRFDSTKPDPRTEIGRGKMLQHLNWNLWDRKSASEGSLNLDSELLPQQSTYLSTFVKSWAIDVARPVHAEFLRAVKPSFHTKCDVDVESGRLLEPVTYDEGPPLIDTQGLPSCRYRHDTSASAMTKDADKLQNRALQHEKREDRAKDIDPGPGWVPVSSVKLPETDRDSSRKFAPATPDLVCHIRPACGLDLERCSAIYNKEVRCGTQAPDTEPINVTDVHALFETICKEGLPFLVCVKGPRPAPFTAPTPLHRRPYDRKNPQGYYSRPKPERKPVLPTILGFGFVKRGPGNMYCAPGFSAKVDTDAKDFMARANVFVPLESQCKGIGRALTHQLLSCVTSKRQDWQAPKPSIQLMDADARMQRSEGLTKLYVEIYNEGEKDDRCKWMDKMLQDGFGFDFVACFKNARKIKWRKEELWQDMLVWAFDCRRSAQVKTSIETATGQCQIVEQRGAVIAQSKANDSGQKQNYAPVIKVDKSKTEKVAATSAQGKLIKAVVNKNGQNVANGSRKPNPKAKGWTPSANVNRGPQTRNGLFKDDSPDALAVRNANGRRQNIW